MSIQRSGPGDKLRQLGHLLLVNMIFSVFKWHLPTSMHFSGVMEVMYLAKYKNIQAPKCVSHVVLKILELF